MRVRMKETVRGAADGFTVVSYVAGEVYDLGDAPRAIDLAQVFLREGWATEVRAEPQVTAAPAVLAPEEDITPAATPPAPAVPPQGHQAQQKATRRDRDKAR